MTLLCFYCKKEKNMISMNAFKFVCRINYRIVLHTYIIELGKMSKE